MAGGQSWSSYEGTGWGAGEFGRVLRWSAIVCIPTARVRGEAPGGSLCRGPLSANLYSDQTGGFLRVSQGDRGL